jgi:CYTH domain-containing protein
LAGLLEGAIEPVEILDRYFRQSTLRLRQMRFGLTIVYKLGQKVRDDPDRPGLVRLTNMYLTEPEFEFMAQLEGAVLVKTRRHWTVGDATLSVDEFSGSLHGLVLAELELPLEAADPKPPPSAVANVTEDDRFSGGQLALLSPTEARELLEVVAGMTGLSASP